MSPPVEKIPTDPPTDPLTHWWQAALASVVPVSTTRAARLAAMGESVWPMTRSQDAPLPDDPG
jgi:hypothetical protein